MVAIHGSVVKSPLHSRCAFNSRVVGNPETGIGSSVSSEWPIIQELGDSARLLVPPLAVADYPEEQIGDNDEGCADQADEPRIPECRICREFGPSILFGEGLDDLQHQRFAVLLIAQQDHTIALLICEEEG